MPSILERPAVRHAALPISVEQYHQLSAAGIVTERTELLRGVIIERMTKSPLHTYIVQLLVKWLESAISPGVYVRQEAPLSLVDSEPEPDVAVVRGDPRRYRTEHPQTAELVIEVAVATIGLDRDKADIYAEAGVPEYWIVIPEQRVVEVYRSPAASGYATCDRLEAPESMLTPLALPSATWRLANLFE
jgi:Uma2 family endonuclease